jgi:hypothetical protein
VTKYSENVNKSLSADPGSIHIVHKELGQWFGDYLKDNGYQAHAMITLIKEMVLVTFPPVFKDPISPENAESALLQLQFIQQEYLKVKEDCQYTKDM